MKNKYSVATLLLLGGLASTTAFAQDYSRVKSQELREDGTPALVQFKADGNAYQLSNAPAALREQLGLSTDDQLLQLKTQADDAGFVHEKYQQYYKGIKVEHATYSVHARQGRVESMSGQFERVRGLNTTPSLDASTALNRALSFVGAKKYMWQDAGEEAYLKAQENDPSATYAPKGELVVVRDMRSANPLKAGKPTLAWKFNVYAQQPVSRAFIYVDAHSGDVVFQDAIIKHAAATGSFATRYSGTQSSTTDSFNGSYRLRDVTRGSGVQTFDMNQGTNYNSAVDFTDANNSWTEYNNTAFDNAALDAHWGAQAVYDYWKNVHGRNSYNGSGAVIKSYVHYDRSYENAYWDGSRMTYGDGATRFSPLTSLDVCAHEIGHAVCSSTANLTYSYESGALNEGFSDIWGAAVEYYKAPNKQTWLIGEDIDKQRPSLRSMSNPNAEGQPDTYQGTYWATGSGDNGGVHTNSGVLNHWFYILSVGKSGTNDKGNAYSVAAIGIDAAAKIAYRTEAVYLTASSNYAAARTYSIQSAKDLYGAGSAQEIAVTNAWYAVGVGAAASGGGTPPPPAPATYCTSKGSNVSYEWLDLVQLGSINRVSGKDGGYYNGTATSTNLAAGSAQTMYLSAGFASTAYTETYDVYIDYNQDGDFEDAGERIISGSSSSSATLSASFTVPTTARSGSTRLRVVMSDNAATTSCGSYSYGETEDYTVNITGGTLANQGVAATSTGAAPAALNGDNSAFSQAVTLYPNPASDVLNIALASKAPVVSASVTDLRGARVANVRFENGQLHVAGLANGVYMLTVSDGQKTFHERFVKQ